ncbi:Transmembrane protein 223 [Trichoplax sp. H2]|nr:Transmembrane protein 223 [Trichoplax sp. H2]|eukprot:RDD37660.1 Transmembrane protein 223 [Trichoplax sp. H2]
MIRLVSLRHKIKSYWMVLQRCKNTQSAKRDIVIYTNKKESFFATISVVSICQLFFWTYLGEFAFSELRDPYSSIKPNEDKKKEELALDDSDSISRSERAQLSRASTRMRVGLATVSIVAGLSFCVIGFFYCYRSVKSLALTRGGIDVKITTYGPFGMHRQLTVPLSNMSAMAKRNETNSPIPIRIRNYSFYFLVDHQGKFLEPRLYDRTISIKRRL